MKREFLLNFKVGDQPLPKEIIDEIMAENGRDIQKTKAGFADYEQVKQDLAQTQEQLEAFKAMDIEAIRSSAREWEEKYNLSQRQHQQQLHTMRFEHLLNTAIAEAKGRNAKAITALLDVENLKNSEDQQNAVSEALNTLKKDCAYLFETAQTPPPFARGTGSRTGAENETPTTLAGALKEKYNNY